MTRAATQARLHQALTRRLAGQPTSTDGELTVVNLCRGAGVGRDSFYRSPQEFKDAVAAAQANRDARQPELVALRDEIAILKRQRRQNAGQHAATVHDMEETVRVYANRIQILALRNSELEKQVRRLHRQLADTDPDVIALPDRS